MGQFDERRAINGTYGQVYLEGELVREATALKAEVQMQFMDVPMCGDLAKHQKFSGMECNGNITMTKINSRMAILISDMIKAGKTPTFTIMSKLADPDSWGAERVVLKGVQFSTLILADWEAQKLGVVSQPFTFTDWDLLDVIDAD